MNRLLTAAAAVVIGAVASPVHADDLFMPPFRFSITVPELPPRPTPTDDGDHLRAMLSYGDHVFREAESAAIERELSASRVEMSYLRSELDMLELDRSRAR